MSHFTVAVITNEQPTDDELSAILQPWHEYECTGVDDEYVIDVDVTDEMRADYEKFGEEGQSFEDFVPYWSSAELREDGRAYRHTNPNAKWDWWQIGGRWTGLLLLKPGAMGRLGRPAWRAEPAYEGTTDQARIRDIQLDRTSAGAKPPRTFALVKDGQWFERGKMGWWATVSGEKDEDRWSDEFDKLLADSGDCWITLVDCHI